MTNDNPIIVEPVAAPDIRDITLEEGKPMTFFADFETMPAIELGEYSGLSLRRQPLRPARCKTTRSSAATAPWSRSSPARSPSR